MTDVAEMTRGSPQSLEILAQLLADPRSHPDAPESVELVQTHISLVAISPTRVLKVKKAVDLGFLDFSTAAKRLHYCQEEVRLNNRLCHGTYEGVVPILSDPNTACGLRIGTESELASPLVVDYAVSMKRLEDRRFMHQLIRDDTLATGDLERVVHALTLFYEEHPATEATSAWGTVERIRLSIDENFEQIEDHIGTLISPAAFDLLRDSASAFLDMEATLFARRVDEGMVRDCHGDLHLDHIHITPERVCIYDCIEFNERFRSIDVANDIAFLAMDLDHNGRPDLSQRFVNRMAETLKDPELKRLLPFYKTYRAIVRAKVAAMKSVENEVPEAERISAEEEAKSYFRLATQYVVSGDRPMVIMVMGRVGTGKSTQAHLLGGALGWRVLSSDETRKRLAGVPLYDRGDDATRAGLYSDKATERTYGALIQGAVDAIGWGKGVILDATFSRHSDRELVRRAVALVRSPAGRPVPHRTIEVVAPDALIRERLKRRESQAQVASDARLSDFEAISAAYESPSLTEQPNSLTVSSSSPPEETHAEILSWLASRFSPTSAVPSRRDPLEETA